MTSNPPAYRLVRAVPLALLGLAMAAAACGVAGNEEPVPGGGQTAVQVAPDGKSASWESGNTGVVMVRPTRESGYVGFQYSIGVPRPVVGADGRRVAPRLERHPVITGVDPGSPAERAGLRRGDVLLAVEGHDAREPNPPGATALRAGDTRTYTIRRGGRELRVRLTASEPWGDWPPTEEQFRALARDAEAN